MDFRMRRLHSIRPKIEAIIRGDPDSVSPGMRRVLWAASLLFGLGVRLKNSGYDTGALSGKTLPCRVVSIGNVVAGGTGKTPMTIYVAGLLRQMGYRPVVLSRGYGGKAEKIGIVVSDGLEILCTPETSGDEPFMMAARLRNVPVIVGGDRYKSGMHAVVEFDPDVIVLDDGFQHRRLRRDLDLVLVDAGRPFGNGYLLPRGMLREPASALARCDAIVITRSSRETDEESREHPPPGAPGNQKASYPEGKPVFRTSHVSYVAGVYSPPAHFPLNVSGNSDATGLRLLKDARVFVFSGIAQNEAFFDVVKRNAKSIAGSITFPDHHPYTDEELGGIVGKARLANADYLVITEKDYVRIAGRVPGVIPVVVVGVKIVFCGDGEADFARFIRQVRKKQ